MKYKTYKKRMTKHKRQQLKDIILILSIILGAAAITFTGQRALADIKVDTSPVEHQKSLSETPYQAIEVFNDTEIQIRELARTHNFQWEDYLIRLAKCESSLNPKNVNVNKDGTKDRGVFQINDYWHKLTDEQAFDVEYATLYTMKLINEGKQHLWACDRIIKSQKI